MLSTKNLIRLLINTLLGFALIYFWLQFVDVKKIVEQLSRVNIFAVLPFILIMVFSNVLRAIRLKILLSEYNIPTLDMVFLNGLSQFLSFTIPLRVGEITKGVYLSTQYTLPFKKTIIWVLLDRFYDFWMVLFLSLALLLFLPTSLPANLKPILICMKNKNF